MLRRHYNAVAAALRSGGNRPITVRAVARALFNENGQFNEAMFTEKALHGPTQEQRSRRYRHQLRLRAERLGPASLDR